VSSILLPNVVYDEGTYRVTMNPWLIDAIWQRGRNYTQFTLAEMAGFSSAYAFRLYEYLKSQCYQHDGKLNETDIYVITVNMYELAFIIGVVVLNNKKSNALFNEKKYKEAFFAVDNPKYTKAAWVLRQKVIDKAVESVNKNSKLQVTYAHNKDTLRFNVTVSHKELFSFVSHIRGLIPKLTEKNAQSIYRQAAGDMGLVEQALAEYEKAKDVKNPTGYIINVIRQMQTANWEPKEDRPKKNSKKKECEHNFSQRKYNFDEMERELLNYNEENEQK
jgi:plasmid replication initiation protein